MDAANWLLNLKSIIKIRELQVFLLFHLICIGHMAQVKRKRIKITKIKRKQQQQQKQHQK